MFVIVGLYSHVCFPVDFVGIVALCHRRVNYKLAGGHIHPTYRETDSMDIRASIYVYLSDKYIY